MAIASEGMNRFMAALETARQTQEYLRRRGFEHQPQLGRIVPVAAEGHEVSAVSIASLYTTRVTDEKGKTYLQLPPGTIIQLSVNVSDNRSRQLGLWQVETPLQVSARSFTAENGMLTFMPSSSLMEEEKSNMRRFDLREKTKGMIKLRADMATANLWGWIRQQPEVLEKLISEGIDPQEGMTAIKMQVKCAEAV
jgi:hypothetical protein